MRRFARPNLRARPLVSDAAAAGVPLGSSRHSCAGHEWQRDAHDRAVLPDRELEKVVDGIVGMKAEPPEVMIQGDVARGRSLYAACAACHGERGEGNEALNAPALARGNDWYWVTQLHNYRAGLRGADPLDTVGAPMRAAAASLPDERSVSDVVAYINTLR